MKANIKLIRGKATLDEIEAKEFNIYLGISLGNKWFTKEHIREYLVWALKYTKSKISILVADTLHSINYEVRNNLSPEKARDKALKQGDKICEMLKEIINNFPTEEQKKIIITRWDEIQNIKTHEKTKEIFNKKFKEDPKFKEKLLKIIKTHTKQENFSNEKNEKLATYLLNELPELLHGYELNETYYNLYIYPKDSLLSKFIDQIQKNQIFPELHEKIENIDKNTFIQLEIQP